MNRLTWLALLWVCVAHAQDAAPVAPAPSAPTPAAAERLMQIPEPGRFKPLFQPFRTETAAISPDGKHLAYSVRDGETVSVVTLAIDQPDKVLARVQVVDDASATTMLALNQREKIPGRINWLGWATNNRVLVETNQVFANTDPSGENWQNWRGAVLGFDADGSNAKVLVSPKLLSEYFNETGENSFDVRRDPKARFTPRVISADQPLPTVGKEENQTNELPPIGSSTDLPETATVTGANAQARALHLFGYDSRRPGAVTLVAAGGPRGSGARSHEFISLDATTGKFTGVTHDFVPVHRTALMDRQGRLRLLLPSSLLASFPLRYDYLGAEGRNRPQPLDDATGIAGFSVSPENYFGARAIPLGFDEDPSIFYYASNLGRDTYGIYSLNLTTKKPGRLTIENPAYDLIGPPAAGFSDQSSLVFDRYSHQLIGVRYDNSLRTTAWLRPEWQAMQAEFERMFPGRTVEISDWDEAGQRFVVHTQGPADPGAFYVYDRAKTKLFEFVRRAPWIDAGHTHLTLPFAYATPDGARISGLVTAPRQPRVKPIPIVVLCPDQPWLRVSSFFQSEVQALAEMGFVVVQLNGRGAWGLGLKQRQSLTSGYDLTQVEDITTTVAKLEQLFNVNPHRVALMGRGHGGFIALRALQIHPDKFRCAIALDPIVDLGDALETQKWSEDDIQPQLTRAWLGDAARLKAAPLVHTANAPVTPPVLLLSFPGPTNTSRPRTYLAARRFAESARATGGTVDFDDLPLDYVAGLPAARAEIFDRIEGFLNVHIYDFKVKLHDLRIIK